MRLAQIARKVGLTPVDIKRFLESEFDQFIGNEPNYKLDENQISAVLEKFPIPIPKVEVPTIVEEPPNEIEDEFDAAVAEMEHAAEAVNEIEIPEIETELAGGTIETVVEENNVEAVGDAEIVTETISEETVEIAELAVETSEASTTEATEMVDETQAKVVESIEEEEKVEVEINYDEPTDIQDSDASFVEVAVDREADLIKAPKVKLDGLKVLGKIELPGKKEPEVVVKTEEEVAQEESDALAELDAAMQLNAQDIKPAKVTRKEAKETKEHIGLEEESYSEFKDARGIYHFSLHQKQNREKALVQVELRRKREAEKEKKKRYYQETMKERKQSEPETISKAKQEKIETKKKKREEKKVDPPKGFWAKFKRWLND